jgi:outer membrane biosynthesis protein TonB
MKKFSILFVALSVMFNSVINGQTSFRSDSTQIVEKAKYLKEDLTGFLSKNVRYPNEALTNNIHGGVILAFTINKNCA